MKKSAVYKATDFLTKIILISLTFVALSLLFFLVQSKVSGRAPSVGGYQMYIVMSGSMSPAVKTGSIVIVKPMDPEEIKLRDIITFRGEIEGENITTHRVVEIDNNAEISFKTKGDANEVEDPMPVSGNQLIGRVVYSIPHVGYAFYFARSRNGVIALLVILIAYISLELVKNLWPGRKKIGENVEKDKGVGVKEER